jgi:hypothetical protein
VEGAMNWALWGLDEDLGVGAIIRWGVFYVWPALWAMAKVRVAVGDMTLAVRGMDVATLGGVRGDMFPPPWEVIGPVVGRICDLSHAVWLVL